MSKDGRDIPDVFLMTADYPQEFSIFLVSTLTNDLAEFPIAFMASTGQWTWAN